MIDYNLQMVERLEARWLDPDCVDSFFKDDEEAWNRADEIAEERWLEREIYDKQSIS